MSTGLVAVAHLAVTLYMAGLVVFVQVVHYPLMAKVGAGDFVSYEVEHMRRTGWVVAPAMLIELGGAIWLAAASVPDAAGASWLGLLLLGVIWVSTGFVQAPAHRRLSRGFDAGVHRRLVSGNWVRTGCWIARVPIAFALLP